MKIAIPYGPWICGPVLTLLAMTAGGNDNFAVLESRTLDGLNVDAMVVNNDHELVMFDCSTRRLRFLETTRNPVTGELTFNLAEDALSVRWDSTCTGWMQHDRGSNLTYVLSSRSRDTNLDVPWSEIRVNVLRDRQFGHSILVNPEGDEPSDGPVDFRYSVSGFTLKPSGAETGTQGRIVIDDTVKGNFDIVELDPSGTSSTHIQRYDYRSRIDCDWPPEDPSPWQCSWNRLIGNGLALEWETESAALPGLGPNDELYLLDPSGGTSRVRRFLLSHEPGPIAISELSLLDLTLSDPFLANGAQSLTLSPSTDQLYVSTRLQSFSEGWLVIANTATQQQTLIDPVLSDEAPPVIDYADPERAFLLVSDSFDPGAALILRVLRGGVVVDSVTVLDPMPNEFPAMAHDPVYGLLYVILRDELIVLQGVGDIVFEGGFE